MKAIEFQSTTHDGVIDLPEQYRDWNGKQVRVILLDDSPAPGETALLSEDALAEDWNREEEDEAWRHLQSGT